MKDKNGKTIVLTARQETVLNVMNAAMLGYAVGLILMGIAYVIIMP